MSKEADYYCDPLHNVAPMDTDKAITKAVCEFLTDKLTALDVAHANLNDETLIIVKGASLQQFQRDMRKNMEHRVSASCVIKNDPNVQQQAEREEGFRDLVLVGNEMENVSGKEELALMQSFLQDLGKKYPVVTWKGIDVIVGYNGSVRLDVTDPNFFDRLDAVMDHLLSHDDLKAFPQQL